MESAHKFQIVDLFNERIKQEEDNLKNELDNLIGKEENISKEVFLRRAKEFSIKLWKELQPLNAKESTLLLLLRMKKILPLSARDFIATCLWSIKRNEFKSLIVFLQEESNIYKLTDTEYRKIIKDFDSFKELSIIVRFVFKSLKKLEIDALQIFKDLYIDDEIVKALLSGEKDEWVKYKDWEINHPEEIKEKTCIALMIFVLIFLKIKERNIPPIKLEIPPLFMYIYATIGCRVHEKVKSEYPDDYRAWQNYITDNILSIFDRKNANMPINIYGIIELGYKNYLENFFDVIYNKHYTNDYRKNITRSLKRKEFAAILPYYEEYCKENNISPDRYYYLGDISEKHEEISSLSNINEKSDESEGTDINRLSMPQNFNNSKIDKLSRLLAASGLIEAKEREYLSYFLGSGNTALKKSEPITWLGTRYSLKYFIDKLYYNGKQSNRWKSVANIFKVSTQGTYKKLAYLSYTNLSKNDYEQKVDEKMKKLIDECIDKALNSTT